MTNTKRIQDLEDALRGLACWLGVGGFNAPEVDAGVFEQKIRDGVAMAVAHEREMCAKIADACHKEREAQASGKSALTEVQSYSYLLIMAKGTEAKRIADTIRKRGT